MNETKEIIKNNKIKDNERLYKFQRLNDFNKTLERKINYSIVYDNSINRFYLFDYKIFNKSLDHLKIHPLIIFLLIREDIRLNALKNPNKPIKIYQVKDGVDNFKKKHKGNYINKDVVNYESLKEKEGGRKNE